ncbi:MAG: glycosyltransferase family 4 protein, partial [Candidatus Omnitrophica bacterium]|nr:glycosyltransferase family 4 protein [Candidatus Omnitrophota bacterium]
FLERAAALFTDKLITISKPLLEEFIKAKLAPANKFITIYSGIEIGKFREEFDINKIKQEFDIKPDELVVGTVARLASGKGHKVFLQAAARIAKELPNVKFMIVGDGPLRNELIKLSKELGINEKCIFTDFRRDIKQITSIFDVAVLASFYEGMGRVLLEAQALGKPVVAFKVGGIPDIVNDGITGILVPLADEGRLAGAIIKLLKDETLHKRMSQAALEWVDLKFSSQKMVDDIVKVYEEFIDKRLKTNTL